MRVSVWASTVAAPFQSSRRPRTVTSESLAVPRFAVLNTVSRTPALLPGSRNSVPTTWRLRAVGVSRSGPGDQ